MQFSLPRPGTGRTLVTTLAASGVALTCGLAPATTAMAATSPAPAPVTASSTSPTTTATARERMPQRIFAADSFWYRRLPTTTPTDPRSAEISQHIYDQGVNNYGTPGHPSISVNTERYAPPMIVARNSDPTVTFDWDNCQGKTYGDTGLIANHLTNIHLPAYAIPAAGTDKEMVVYNADTHTLTETWVTTKTNGRWTACWGGTIKDTTQNKGVFDAPWGVTASGLSMQGGTIRPEELAAGHIDHVVGLALPNNAPWPVISAPANRTDGYNPSGRAAPAEGQMLRIPASVDLDSMPLSPTARTIAKAAQEYGVIVWDTAGSISFRAENPLGMTSDPYPTLFRGRADWQEMAGDPTKGERGFPLELLQALPMNYETPLNAGTSPVVTQPVLSTVRQTGAWVDQTDAKGRSWAGRGTSFDSTQTDTAMAGRTIAGASDNMLYASTVQGMSSYKAKVVNGTYDVKLYTAEDYWNAPGKRVFSVTAEGATAIKDLDPFARAGGMYRAYEPSFTVKVTDGELDLGFVPTKDRAILGAIQITPTPAGGAPKPALTAPILGRRSTPVTAPRTTR